LQRVQQGVDFLTTTSRNVPERHRSLRVVFDQSWQMLSPSERQVLRRLAVFRGPFRFDSAAAITGGSLTILAALFDKSFFRQEGTRYNMHHLLRQYLSGRLQDADEVQATQAGYLQYYVELSRAAAPEVRGANQIEWLDRLDDEHANIHVAILHALEDQQFDAALEIEGNLWLFWQARGHITEALGWIEPTLVQATNTNTVAYGNALHAAGFFSWCQGDYDKAEHYHHRALAIRQKLNDQAGIGVSLNNLGILAWAGRRFEEALAFYEQSLATRRAIGFTYGEATVLRNMGIVFATIGDFTQARSHYGQAVMLFRQLNDLQGIAETLHSLGKVAYRNGDYQQARSYAEEAIALSRQVGNYEKIALGLESLTLTAIDLAEYVYAQTSINESLQLYLQVNDKAGVARDYVLQGWIAYYTHQIPEALELAEQGTNMLRQMTAPEDLGSGILLKAKCLLKQQHQAMAVRTLGECFSEALHLADFQVAAEAALELAHIAVQSRQTQGKNDLLAVFWQLHKRSYNALLPRVQAKLAQIHEQSVLQARHAAEASFPIASVHKQQLSDAEMLGLVDSFASEFADLKDT
ncbi:MAG TPA: tetratricopeptide repeat protein, partial [Aggregatilineales bacterium]|nr:tetratricopeptide repeat protein [Aggregatilineales bacterium]